MLVKRGLLLVVLFIVMSLFVSAVDGTAMRLCNQAGGIYCEPIDARPDFCLTKNTASYKTQSCEIKHSQAINTSRDSNYWMSSLHLYNPTKLSFYNKPDTASLGCTTEAAGGPCDDCDCAGAGGKGGKGGCTNSSGTAGSRGGHSGGVGGPIRVGLQGAIGVVIHAARTEIEAGSELRAFSWGGNWGGSGGETTCGSWGTNEGSRGGGGGAGGASGGTITIESKDIVGGGLIKVTGGNGGYGGPGSAEDGWGDDDSGSGGGGGGGVGGIITLRYNTLSTSITYDYSGGIGGISRDCSGCDEGTDGDDGDDGPLPNKIQVDEICGDGEDNDFDFKIDCADPTCSSDAACNPDVTGAHSEDTCEGTGDPTKLGTTYLGDYISGRSPNACCGDDNTSYDGSQDYAFFNSNAQYFCSKDYAGTGDDIEPIIADANWKWWSATLDPFRIHTITIS